MTDTSKAPWDWPGSTVDRIVDGDTLAMNVTRDLGFGGTASFTVRLRLNRINASPGYTDAGKAATAYLTSLLPTGAYDMETVSPYKFGGPTDSPGEWMCEITLPDGRNVSDAMVASGNAVYWDGEGPRPGG